LHSRMWCRLRQCVWHFAFGSGDSISEGAGPNSPSSAPSARALFQISSTLHFPTPFRRARPSRCSLWGTHFPCRLEHPYGREAPPNPQSPIGSAHLPKAKPIEECDTHSRGRPPSRECDPTIRRCKIHSASAANDLRRQIYILHATAHSLMPCPSTNCGCPPGVRGLPPPSPFADGSSRREMRAASRDGRRRVSRQWMQPIAHFHFPASPQREAISLLWRYGASLADPFCHKPRIASGSVACSTHRSPTTGVSRPLADCDRSGRSGHDGWPGQWPSPTATPTPSPDAPTGRLADPHLPELRAESILGTEQSPAPPSISHEHILAESSHAAPPALH
jgi:hypothetical protein